ncbi:hypothetical protein KBA41_01935 [Candidatus Ozemobacteraceae bacterium]|nr:hypothetical protein [Candidatus Ozemobacteraceae bacterium]
MNSPFPALQQRLPALLAGAFLFVLFAVWTASLLLENVGHPDIDIVLSPSARLTPGETTEIALYALERDKPHPIRQLKLEVHLRAGGQPVPLVPPCAAVEKHPGLYTARISTPKSLNDGTYELAVYRTNALRQPLAVFSIQAGTNYALAATPPGFPLHTGGSYRFDLAAIDPATSRPLPHLPIRCKVTTPDGFTTTNRVVFTTRQGTGVFTFSLHPESPTGEYLFDFSCGNRSLQFRVPVVPSLPPLVFLRNMLTRAAANLPDSVSGLFSGSPIRPERQARWSLHRGKAPHSSIRWAKASGRVVRANFDLGLRRFAVIELWQRNRLLYSSLCPQASGTIKISLRNRLPLTAPIKVRLWQKKRRQVWADEYIIPVISGVDEATRRFRRLAEDCAPSHGHTLARLLTPAAVSVQVGSGFQRADRLTLAAGFLNEVFQLTLPWLLILGLVLPFAGRICTVAGKMSCETASAHLVPVTAAATIFFTLGSSGISEPPGPILLFVGFLVAALILNVSRQAPAGESLARSPARTLPQDVRLAPPRAIETFVLLGLLLSSTLFVKLFASGLAVQASQTVILAIVAVVSGLMTGVYMLGTGSLNLSRPEPSLFGAVSDLVSRITAGVAKGRWKAALLLTLLMSGLFAGILRLHTFLHPSGQELVRQDNRRAWRQKNAHDFRQHALQFIPAETSPAEPDSVESEILSADISQSIQSRFLLLQGTKLWTGRKIQRINVFTKHKEFLDRWIRALTFLRPTLWTICLELNARAERLQLLDPSERRGEQERLEACLTVFGKMLARELQSGKTHSHARKQFLADMLSNLTRAVSTDSAFRQALQALPAVPAAGEEADPAAILIEYQPATAPVDISAIVSPAFRSSGFLRLGSGSGVSVSFPIRLEMTPIVRGASFRETFEITRLEALREMPVLLELVFTP